MGQESTSPDYKGIYLTKITLGDVVIFIFVLGISALSFFLLRNVPQKDSETYYLYVDNRLTCQGNLQQDTTFSVYGPRGESVVKVEKGKIGVIKAPCPNKICKKTGMVQKPSKPIICVPNRLVIIVKSQEKSKVDGVTK